MSYFINNQQKLNDILFAQRNKSYGAYALRSSYGNTMLKSLSLMIFGFGTCITIAYYATRPAARPGNVQGQVLVPDIIYTLPVDLKKDEPKAAELPKPAPKEPAGKTAAATGVVISDSVAAFTRTTELIQTAQSVATSSVGTEGPVENTGGPSAGKGTLTTTGSSLAVRGNYEVDSQPEFEGGLGALARFVASHLRYPSMASEADVQGTVFVKFVVDEKGKVGSLSLLNNLGYGLDDEAVRVVAMIPNFKTPAKMNGQPVKVYYQLPIKFKLR